MADNIKTKDRDLASIDLAAKDIAGVLHPRNILTDPSGADITPLTDAQLRAGPVPVSAESLPLPAGAATETTLATLATEATLATLATEATLAARTGSLTETAPATDTASSGINGRLQRIAQRLTSLIALLPATLGPKAGASSLSVVEATPTTVTIVSLTTSATGTTYTAFGSQACEQLDIVNTAVAAVDIEVRRGGSGYTIVVPAGSSRMFVGIANASDLQVRRLDQSNTQVTFTAEAIKA